MSKHNNGKWVIERTQCLLYILFAGVVQFNTFAIRINTDTHESTCFTHYNVHGCFARSLHLCRSFCQIVKLSSHYIHIHKTDEHTHTYMLTSKPTATFVWIIHRTHTHTYLCLWRTVYILCFVRSLFTLLHLPLLYACLRTNTCEPIKMAPKAYTAQYKPFSHRVCVCMCVCVCECKRESL